MENKENFEELLNVQLDRINSWINNCDQKAGILLAFMGVLVTIFMTSSTASEAKKLLLKPVCNTLQNDADCIFLWQKVILILSLIVFFVCFFIAIYCFLSVLKSRTSKSKVGKNLKGLPNDKSYLHFDSFKKDELSYENYRNILKDESYIYLDDLTSQIYINSVICSKKFSYYRAGFLAMIFFLIAFFTFISILLLIF